MKTIVLIVMVVTVGMLHGISYTASFQLSNVSFSSDSRGYEVVDYNDLLKTNLRGAPELPVQYLHFIIPIGMSVGSIQITTSQTQLPGTHNVMPSPGFDSILNPPDAAEPDSSIYSLNNLYPNQCVQILRHEYFAGANRIAVVAVYPIQYIPQSGIIVFNQNISFSLNLVNGEQPAAVPISRIARDHDLTLRALQALVSNTGDISTYMYQPNINIIPETTDIEEVIIGPAQYESDFTD